MRLVRGQRLDVEPPHFWPQKLSCLCLERNVKSQPGDLKYLSNSIMILCSLGRVLGPLRTVYGERGHSPSGFPPGVLYGTVFHMQNQQNGFTVICLRGGLNWTIRAALIKPTDARTVFISPYKLISWCLGALL